MIAAICNHQIVQNPAGLVREHRIALPSLREAHDINWDQLFERASGIFQASRSGPQRDLPHMRNVEQASGSTSMQMLAQNTAGILHRHFIARERDHSRAAFDMEAIEWRT